MCFRASTWLKVTVMTLAVVTAGEVYGQDALMIQDNPYKIGVLSYYGEECPGSLWSLDREIDSQLVRHRIKRVKHDEAEVALLVSVFCTKPGDYGIYAFTLDAVFRKEAYLQTNPDRVGRTIFCFTNPISHGRIGIGYDDGPRNKNLEDAIEKAVESALVAYVKANFDL